MVWLRAHFLLTRAHFAKSLIGSSEKIRCDSSVGKALRGSRRFDDNVKGALFTGREAAPILTGEEALVRDGEPGKETYENATQAVSLFISSSTTQLR